MRTCVADVEGFTGVPEIDKRYEVTDSGEVWTKAYIKHGCNRHGPICYEVSPKRVKTRIDRRGYEVFDVSATVNGIKVRRFLRVHRAIAHAFLGEIPEGYQVNHINGDKSDNRLTNLEIVTPRENVVHSYETCLLYTSDAADE